MACAISLQLGRWPVVSKLMLPALPALPALLVLALLAFVGAPAHAQWTWRDKSGQVNASDRPPPRDIADKDILSRPVPDARRVAPAASAAASAATGPVKGPLDRELETRKRSAEQEQQAKAKADDERLAQQRAENCRRARSQQAALDSGQRIARVNAKGEREVLDDRGRAEELRQARDAIASDCR